MLVNRAGRPVGQVRVASRPGVSRWVTGAGYGHHRVDL